MFVCFLKKIYDCLKQSNSRQTIFSGIDPLDTEYASYTDMRLIRDTLPFKSLGLIVIANFKGIHTINVTSFASAQNDANTQVMRLSK